MSSSLNSRQLGYVGSSLRLRAIADMAALAAADIRKCVTYITAADVGCDHGYISAELIRRGIVDRVTASDLRPGPLERARKLAGTPELSGRMIIRQCDGLQGYVPGEADLIIMAGIGGRLMLRLLSEGDIAGLGVRRMILQPQSEWAEVRKWLRENTLHISDERMVTDEGKTYLILDVSVAKEERPEAETEVSGLPDAFTAGENDPSGEPDDLSRRICDRFGRILIERQDPVLRSYLEHRKDVLRGIVDNIRPVSAGDQEMGTAWERTAGVREELGDVETVLSLFLQEN